jgi:cytochrome b
MNTKEHEGVAARSVTVWDLPTRLFHWGTAVLVAAAYVTWRLNWMDWHALIGEALLALVLFRLLWGVWGGGAARFAGFIVAPVRALRHLAHLVRREPDEEPGHNPAGGWMVLLLMLLLLGQALSGLYVNNEVADQGPLSAVMPAAAANLITDLHDTWLWGALLGAVALHLLAIAIYWIAKGQNLLLPMITGRKRLPDRIASPRSAPLLRAAMLMAAAIAVTVALTVWL